MISPNQQLLREFIKVVTLGSSHQVSKWIENHSEVDVKTFDYQRSIPMILAVARADKPMALIDVLIKAGISINQKDANGWTALHTAVAFHNSFDYISALIKRGADVDAQNKHGMTPLMNTINSNTVHSVHALLHHGANLALKDSNQLTYLNHVSKFASEDYKRSVQAILSYQDNKKPREINAMQSHSNSKRLKI